MLQEALDKLQKMEEQLKDLKKKKVAKCADELYQAQLHYNAELEAERRRATDVRKETWQD